jgi:hypothetical protein
MRRDAEPSGDVLRAHPPLVGQLLERFEEEEDRPLSDILVRSTVGPLWSAAAKIAISFALSWRRRIPPKWPTFAA